jgi:hypothetical protein
MSPSYPGHVVLVRKYMISYPGKNLCKGSSYGLQSLSGLSSYSKRIVQNLTPNIFLNFLFIFSFSGLLIYQHFYPVNLIYISLNCTNFDCISVLYQFSVSIVSVCRMR